MVRSRKPKYQLIADELVRLIKGGKLPPGARLPTEAELAERHKVTRPTIRQAYRQLITEGLVVKVPREGHFVHRPQMRPWWLTERGRYVDSWQRSKRDFKGPCGQEVTVEIADGGRIMAGKLGSGTYTTLRDLFGRPDDEYLCRNRVRSLDGEPVQLSSAYVPLFLAEGTELRRPQLMADDVVAHLSHRLQRPVSGVLDSALGRLATADESHALQVPLGTPLFEVLRQIRFAPDDEVLVVERLLMDARETWMLMETVQS